MRLTTNAAGNETSEVRYYIITRYLGSKRFAAAVRGHRGYTLDVRSGEDDDRKLTNNSTWLRRFAVTRAKRHTAKDTVRGKTLRCAYSSHFVAEVLTGDSV
jgi:hypothetical protein